VISHWVVLIDSFPKKLSEIFVGNFPDKLEIKILRIFPINIQSLPDPDFADINFPQI